MHGGTQFVHAGNVVSTVCRHSRGIKFVCVAGLNAPTQNVGQPFCRIARLRLMLHSGFCLACLLTFLDDLSHCTRPRSTFQVCTCDASTAICVLSLRGRTQCIPWIFFAAALLDCEISSYAAQRLFSACLFVFLDDMYPGK